MLTGVAVAAGVTGLTGVIADGNRSSTSIPWIIGSPYLTGVPPIRLLRPARPDPAGRPYGALATAPFVATVRDRLRRGSFLACRATRVVAMRTRRIWFCGLANPRAFLATSFAVRLCASAFALE